MTTSMYCPHCKQQVVMESVEITGQSSWHKRPFYERSYRCRRCGNPVKTVEVLTDYVFECDHMRKLLNKIAAESSASSE